MTSQQFNQSASTLQDKINSARALLLFASAEHGKGLYLTSSFGLQSAVLLHMVSTLLPDVKIIRIDTQHGHPETEDYFKELTRLLKLEDRIMTYQGRMTAQDQLEKFGEPAIGGKPTDIYKQINKVEPRNRAFKELGVTGWITGVQHRQSEQRGKHEFIEKMEFGNKFFPTLNWSSKDVFDYMKAFDLPQHPLWHKGYTTVGDVFENPYDRGECGLHDFDPVI